MKNKADSAKKIHVLFRLANEMHISGNYNEETVKLQLTLPLLEDLLGYERGDIHPEYPIGAKRADILLKVDDKPKVIVEVKNLDQELEKHKMQAIRYADEKRIPWVILTNGMEIRLYKTFIEGVEIARAKPIFSSNLKDLPARFDELYDLVSKERLHTIEKTAEVSIRRIKEAVTAEKLEETLRNSKELLFNNISEEFKILYSSDRAFKKRVDDWLQQQGIEKIDKDLQLNLCKEGAYTILNRLVFRKICEDRGFVNKPKVNVQAINSWKQIISKNSMNRLLKEIFGDEFSQNFSGFFDSPLFDSIKIDEIDLDESIIEKSLLALCDYDFKEINRDILGNVYQKHIDKDERKRLGQFYTPDWIIEFIIDHIPISEKTRILDPCCGSGGFLIYAYKKLRQMLKERGFDDGKIHEKILQENLSGIDINPFASQLTVMNLLLQNPEHPTGNFNIVIGNTLSSSLMNYTKSEAVISKIKKSVDVKKSASDVLSQKYDVIIGNPPYFKIFKDNPINQTPEYKEIKSGMMNAAAVFINKSLKLLNDGGYLGFIVPKQLTYTDSWDKLRSVLFKKTKILYMIDMKKAFEGVLLEQVILILQKNNANENHQIKVGLSMEEGKIQLRGGSPKNCAKMTTGYTLKQTPLPIISRTRWKTTTQGLATYPK